MGSSSLFAPKIPKESLIYKSSEQYFSGRPLLEELSEKDDEIVPPTKVVQFMKDPEFRSCLWCYIINEIPEILDRDKEIDPYIYELCKYGIPPKYRHDAWLRLTGANKIMTDGYYQKLLSNASDKDRQYLPIINADIPRTIPAISWNDEELNQIRNILLVYSRHNPELGYCQGLNSIVVNLLYYLSEEESFWVLCQIVDILLPSDYYTTLIGALTNQKVLGCLLYNSCNQLTNILRDWGYNTHDLTVVSLSWFVTLFSYPFSQELTSRIWDVFFIEGGYILLFIGLAFFKIQNKSLCFVKTYGEALGLVESTPNNDYDITELLNIAEDEYNSISSKVIENLISYHRSKINGGSSSGKKKEDGEKDNNSSSVKIEDDSNTECYCYNKEGYIPYPVDVEGKVYLDSSINVIDEYYTIHTKYSSMNLLLKENSEDDGIIETSR